MTEKALLVVMFVTLMTSFVQADNPLAECLAGKVICIDPGHPSETSAGTRGKKVTENHVNWVIALTLGKKLEALGASVILTKDIENELMPNRRRAEIANENQANLMIRLHCDAGSKSGFRIFYPDRQGKRFGVTGPSFAVIKKSKEIASVFHHAMNSVLSKYLKSLGVAGDSETYVGNKQGALTGSIFSAVPVLTIEMCVLTNPKDERFISSPKGKALMVKALLEGSLAVLNPSVKKGRG